MIPVFDGHNDVLLHLYRSGRPDAERAFLEARPGGHLDLAKARAGGFGGGLFAMFVPSDEEGGNSAHVEALMTQPAYDVPLPPSLDLTASQRATLHMASLLVRLERVSDGAIRICRSVADIRASADAGALAAVLHVEGAEAIDPEFRMLDILQGAGLRSLGPVWSRPNAFGHGVPFRFPAGPDIGPGLTDLGRELVRRCNTLKILIDLSHLNEQGFRDVASLSDAPLVASHSNAHALCPHSRNLTDGQLAAIRESGGFVGVNFASGFLRPDGRMLADTPLETIVRHADHLIERLGVD